MLQEFTATAKMRSGAYFVTAAASPVKIRYLTFIESVPELLHVVRVTRKSKQALFREAFILANELATLYDDKRYPARLAFALHAVGCPLLALNRIAQALSEYAYSSNKVQISTEVFNLHLYSQCSYSSRSIRNAVKIYSNISGSIVLPV